MFKPLEHMKLLKILQLLRPHKIEQNIDQIQTDL